MNVGNPFMDEPSYKNNIKLLVVTGSFFNALYRTGNTKNLSFINSCPNPFVNFY